MATIQLPLAQYTIAGQLTATGYIISQNAYGIEEDSETLYDEDGRFKCKITYSRRSTLSVSMEVTSGTPTYQDGGEIASGVFDDGAGNATAWKIRSASLTKTRGPQMVELDLIAQNDLLA